MYQLKPDIDKLLRALLDGLTGIAFPDDRLVVHVDARKRYAVGSEPAGALVTVGWVE